MPFADLRDIGPGRRHRDDEAAYDLALAEARRDLAALRSAAGLRLPRDGSTKVLQVSDEAAGRPSDDNSAVRVEAVRINVRAKPFRTARTNSRARYGAALAKTRSRWLDSAGPSSGRFSEAERTLRKERVAAAKDALARSVGVKGDHVAPARAALKMYLQRLNEPDQPDDARFELLINGPFTAPTKQKRLPASTDALGEAPRRI